VAAIREIIIARIMRPQISSKRKELTLHRYHSGCNTYGKLSSRSVQQLLCTKRLLLLWARRRSEQKMKSDLKMISDVPPPSIVLKKNLDEPTLFHEGMIHNDHGNTSPSVKK
jgi:hypothetical protein